MLPQYQVDDRQDVVNDRYQIQQLTARWAELWSPKNKTFTGEGFEQIFVAEGNGLTVFDNIGGSVVVLHSFREYLNTWRPLMDQFVFWEITIEDDLQICVSGDLAFTTFSFLGFGQDKDEKGYKVRQYGTHIWKRINGQWRLIHEHLTVGE